MNRHFLRIAAAACVLSAAALSGCVVTPVGVEGEVVAYQPPPPVRYEVIGVAPAPGYFWIGGAWFWEGGRYDWRPGHWEEHRGERREERREERR
jgi:hypothetical protein